MIRLKIIVPMYNVEKWVGNCIQSIKNQVYTDFECVIIDDISTDMTVAIVEDIIKGDPRFTLIVNQEKKYALQNIYEGIEFLDPADEDVIVTIDGDDWLYDDSVFHSVVEAYRETGCWMTYGNYIEYPNGRFPVKPDYPQHIIDSNTYRDYQWISSHLRTFKYKLWKNINREDLLDELGNFYKMGWDLAFMFPMLEMSGGKFVNIKKPLYVYNIANPLNDNKVNVDLQISVDREVRQKKKYEPIVED